MNFPFRVLLAILTMLAMGTDALAKSKTKSSRTTRKPAASAPAKTTNTRTKPQCICPKGVKKCECPPAQKSSSPAGSGKQGGFSSLGGTGAGGSGGGSDGGEVLHVRGQSRNLNMMLILKNRGDKIDGVEIRKNYNREIKQTQY